MPTTTNGFPYPSDNTATNVPSDLQALATAADNTVVKVATPTTKGDLVTRSATAEVRLPVGTDNEILKALSSEANGIVWTAQRMEEAITPIAWTSLSTATASVTFSSIPTSYTDLVLVWNARSTLAAKYTDNMWLRVNGISTTQYNSKYGFNAGGRDDGAGATGWVAQGNTTAPVIGIIPAALLASTKSSYGKVVIPHSYSTLGTEKGFGWESWGVPTATHTIDFYSLGTTAAASTTAHLHLTTPHSYIVGDRFQVVGHTTTGFNGTYAVSAITSAITNTAATSTTCTITSLDHGLRAGDSVVVAAVTSPTRYNGTFTVASTPTRDTFTYAFAGSATTSAANTGTITGNKTLHYASGATSAITAVTAAPASTFTQSNGLALGNVEASIDAAYTSFTFGAQSGTFDVGSTFALYGWTKV